MDVVENLEALEEVDLGEVVVASGDLPELVRRQFVRYIWCFKKTIFVKL